MKRVAVAFVFVVGLGCGKQVDPKAEPAGTASATAPTKAEPAARPDKGVKMACSYLTEAEATAILGAPAKHDSKPDAESCDVTTTADDILVFDLRPDTALYDDVISLMQPTDKLEPVANLGEKAQWIVSDVIAPHLYVVKGGRTLHIYGAGKLGKEKVIEAARQIATRM